MPLETWRSYAPKVRKKPKSDIREYTRAAPLELSRKAKRRYSVVESWEVKQEEKEETEVTSQVRGHPAAPPGVENTEFVNLPQTVLRPPIETYEALDDEIEKHLKMVNQQKEKTNESQEKETKTRKRRAFSRSRRISSEIGCVEPSGSSGSGGKKKIRREENGSAIESGQET